MIKNLTLYAISNFLSKGISFFIVIILSNYYSVENYGLISLTNTYIGLFSSFFAFGLCEGVQRFYFKWNDNKQESNWFVLLLLQQVIIYIITIILLFLHKLNFIFVNFDWSLIILIFVIGNVRSIINILQTFLQMDEKSLKYALISLCVSIIDLLLVIIFIKKNTSTVNIRFIYQLISLSLTLLTVYYMSKKYLKISAKINLNEILLLLKFTFPAMILPLISWVITSIDKIYISKMINISSLGTYGLASSISQIMIIVYLSFNTAYTPVFYKNYENKDKVKKIQQLFISFFILLGVFGSSLGQILLPLVIKNRDYLVSFKIIPYLILGLLFYVVSSINMGYLAYKFKTKYILYISVITCINNIILNYVFLLRFGMIGAIIATNISYFIQMLLSFGAVKKIAYIGWDLKKLVYTILIYLIYLFLFYFKFNNILYIYYILLLFLIPISLKNYIQG